MVRWAIFADFRGVLYCEPVNDSLKVYRKNIPARAAVKKWNGKIKYAAREATYAQHVEYLGPRYSEENIHLFTHYQTIPDGYKFCPNIVYMEENYWGPVEVLKFIDGNDPRGAALQHHLRRITPEGRGMDSSIEPGKRRNNKANPLPITDTILAILYQGEQS